MRSRDTEVSRRDELDEEAATHREVADLLNEMIVRWKPDGERTYVNDSYCKRFGLNRREAVGSSFYPLIPEADRDTVREKVASLSPEHPEITEAHRALKPDGSVTWQEWTTRGIFDAGGELEECLSVGRDITERRQAEASLRESEARYRTLFDQAPEAIVLARGVDREHFRFVDCNGQAEQLFGRRREELLQLGPEDLMPGIQSDGTDSHERVKSVNRRLYRLQPGEQIMEEFELQRPDGDLLLCEVRLTPFPDREGLTVRGSFLDVSERRRAVEALRKSEEKFSKAFRSSPDAFMITRLADGQIVEVNEGFERMSGYRKEEALGRTTVELGMWQEDSRRSELVRRVMIDGHVRNLEVQARHVSGRIGYVLLSAETIELGGEPHLVSIGRDITERREAQAEIDRLRKRLELENEYLREEVCDIQDFGDIVGQSEALRKSLEQVDLVAGTEAPVLIEGESGTGKELIARAIHARSSRHDKPLVRVNCASIPRELFESEFFGHVRGAFTGALRDRTGRFELADGGSLFLDEVGEIPLELQSKLLRILQEGEFERIGEESTRRVNVRVIAATNRNLESEIGEKRFRKDLYFRLSVFPIKLVPLRERPEDIAVLAQHYLDITSRRYGVRGLRLKQKHVLQLEQYEWPGNVRELQNVIQRAVITSRNGQLDLELPASSVGVQPFPSSLTIRRPGEERRILTVNQIKALERESITAALDQCGWKVWGPGGAAELLELNPSTLSSRMRALGIRRRT